MSVTVQPVTGRSRNSRDPDAVWLTLFGPPRVTRGGIPATFDTRKAVALLARVGVSGRPQARETLAALLWPDLDTDRARAALRRTLSVTGTIGPALRVNRATVSLDPALVRIDVTDFEHLAAAEDSGSWRAAADLATDQFLAGFSLRDAPAFDDWQSTTAASLAQDLGRMLDRLVVAASATGDLDQALADARRRLDLDPLHEPAHQTTMRILAWRGDRSGAMNQFRACARILDRELGVAPLAETLALYDQVREERLPSPVVPRSRSLMVTDSPSPPPSPSDNVEGTAGPASGVPMTPLLVGRGPVLERLRRQWSACGPGRVSALVGDAGSGRSAVAGAFLATTREVAVPLVLLRGHEAERGMAFGVVTDLVRRIVAVDPSVIDALSPADAAEIGRFLPGAAPHDPPALDSPGGQARLFDAVLGLVSHVLGSSPDGAGVLAVDDAHWLDSASADFVGYLARRPPDRVLVLLTWRAKGEPPALRGAEVDRIALTPLGLADATDLVTQLGIALNPTAMPALVQRTGGSPRLLREYCLAVTGGDELPSVEIGDLVLTRLATAPDITRQVVAAAAVVGVEADPELLRATSGRADTEVVDAIEDAVDRGLLVEIADRGVYDVPYDQMRDVIRARLSDARERLLHSRAADALIPRNTRDPGGTPAAAIAGHLGRAGRDEEAAAWHWRAASEARALWAHAETLDQLASALDRGHSPEVTHRAMGETLTALGRYRESITEYERAAAIADDPSELASLEHLLADVHHRVGAWATARAHLENALALLADDTDDSAEILRARATSDLALVLYREGDLPAAAAVATTALSHATSTGDAAALAQTHDVLGVLAAARGDYDEARRQLRASLAYAAPLGDPATAVAALNNLARLESSAGDLPAALAAAQHALVLGERHGDRHRLAALHTNLADLLHSDDRPDEAFDQLKRAAELFADVDRESERQPEIWKLVAW
jgi:DNA-binding SARP family transcriptional activator